jgi:(2Fe-2S) ferredoxin
VSGFASRFLFVALLAGPLAGCLAQSGAQQTPADGITLPPPLPLDPALVVGKDRALLTERVRAREIDVATDPKNPDHMAAVMMVPWPTQYDLKPYDSMEWTGLALSSDGGTTWDYQALPGYPGDSNPNPWGPGTWALGDAVVAFLPDGSLAMSILPIRAPVQISLVFAVFQWGSHTPAFVNEIAKGALGVDGQYNVPTSQEGPHVDKDQVFIDAATGHIYIGYSERWQVSEEARAMFTKSTDGGHTFSAPKAIDPPFPHYIGSRKHQMGTWPFITKDHRLLVTYADGTVGTLHVVESKDDGATFSAPRDISTHPGEFLTSVAIDQTGGPNDGTIYVVEADGRNGGDSDVFLLVSRDDGQTWEDNLRVNQDAVGNGREQRMPEVVVEPDGAVAIVYMGQVDGPNDWQAFVARSIDGGRTVKEYRVSSASTDPACFNNQPSFLTHLGDYLGISYNRAGVVAIWEDGRKCTSEVPYSEAWEALLPTRETA